MFSHKPNVTGDKQLQWLIAYEFVGKLTGLLSQSEVMWLVP